MPILRTTGLAIALLASLVAGAWTGASIARTATSDPRALFGRVLDATALRRLGLRALELDIANSDYLAGVNRSPLQVELADVSRVLEATYDEEATSAKAREVHRALLDFIERYPADSIFRISIVRERPVLADSLSRVLLAKYRALPDCGFTDDVGTLFSALDVRLFGGSGDQFFYEDHPDCRPPDVVASRVEEGIAQEFTTTAESGPDSLDVAPEEPDDASFSRAMHAASLALDATAWRWPAILLAAAGLTVGLLAGVTALWRVGLGFGLGLVTAGGSILLFAPARIDAALAGSGTVGQASEVWAALGVYAFRRAAEVSGVWALAGGASVIAGSLLLMWILTRGRAVRGS